MQGGLPRCHHSTRRQRVLHHVEDTLFSPVVSHPLWREQLQWFSRFGWSELAPRGWGTGCQRLSASTRSIRPHPLGASSWEQLPVIVPRAGLSAAARLKQHPGFRTKGPVWLARKQGFMLLSARGTADVLPVDIRGDVSTWQLEKTSEAPAL